jgi:uncharacterized protein YyaL (SSP411 family)
MEKFPPWSNLANAADIDRIVDSWRDSPPRWRVLPDTVPEERISARKAALEEINMKTRCIKTVELTRAALIHLRSPKMTSDNDLRQAAHINARRAEAAAEITRLTARNEALEEAAKVVRIALEEHGDPLAAEAADRAIRELIEVCP